jgi:hypothetical protein
MFGHGMTGRSRFARHGCQQHRCNKARPSHHESCQ